MAVYGIICEFNPFHRGHEYIIESARRDGADCVVCVMSGNAVQRGELAVADRYIRAEAAVRCGADLVLELPFPWCASAAESFAAAGVRILSEFVDILYFGSECGDVRLLEKCADAALTALERGEYAEKLRAGARSAEAYFSVFEEKCGINPGSNDILGIEYIKAIKKQGAQIKPVTLRRMGADYRDENTDDTTKFQSAAAIRKIMSEGRTKEAFECMPYSASEIFERAVRNGELCLSGFPSKETIAFYRLHDTAYFEKIACCRGGLANRICESALASSDFAEMFEKIRTKRYTDAKLRRAILFGMTGVEDSDILSFPSYTVLLAANERGRKLLSCKRAGAGIKIVTKQADAVCYNDTASVRQRALGSRLDALFTLACETPRPSDVVGKKSPYIDSGK